jgi:hypothetical protein
MTDTRLQHKIDETKAIADRRGLDLRTASLLVTFELPLWGVGPAGHELSGLGRFPGTAVAATTSEPLPTVCRAVEAAPSLHVLAESGLVARLSGGATLQIYPSTALEMQSFAVALFTGAAPLDVHVALGAFVSSGRQEVTFDAPDPEPALAGSELLYAVRGCGGTVSLAKDEEQSVVVEDDPAELEAARAALAGELAGRSVSVLRMPSGRFRIKPGRARRPVPRERIDVLAQEIAIASDRFLERRGGTRFGFATEPVARWEHSAEAGARRLAQELFGYPDTVLTHLGLHPFKDEGSLFFAYEGSETVWEAANKGISYVTVRDLPEYGRILHAIRKGA